MVRSTSGHVKTWAATPRSSSARTWSSISWRSVRMTARCAASSAPNSDAAEKGFQRGDLIISVNNQGVTTPAQVLAAVDAARRAGRTSVLLFVQRGNGPQQFIAVDIGAR